MTELPKPQKPNALVTDAWEGEYNEKTITEMVARITKPEGLTDMAKTTNSIQQLYKAITNSRIPNAPSFIDEW
jgi:DNA-binding phage protein